jgi:hypothetical protein
MIAGMKRREFITLLGGAAAAWPLAARAQQGERIRRVGVLSATGMDDHENKVRLAAFQQRLQQLGWTDGHNVRIDYRFAAANLENYRNYAAELVALAPDVILAPGNSNTKKPVALPPGRDRLSTKPEPTGSAAIGNTIGIVRVAWSICTREVMI